MAKHTKKDLIPFPVKIYPSTNILNYIIQIILQCYYSLIKPKPQHTGTFMPFGQFIWIHHRATIDQLYHAGFFGKGSLSRSEPTWLDRNIQQKKDSLEEITVARRRKRRNQPIVDNPNLLKPDEILEMTDSQNVESFQLDLYEAFFLSYALNVLTIQNANLTVLCYDKCWTLFNQCNRSFHVNYAVYHFYRSIGWVPKCGSKFGVDFVLYQSGPKYKHAEYAITIIPIYPNTMEQPPTWDWLLRLNRVCTQVKKTLILCYVDIPHDTSSYTNLNEYRIRQVIFKRWSAQRNRE